MSDHEHGEAFRHMRYGTKDGRVIVNVWNSRDGVTPFGFTDPDTGLELTHLPPWTADRYDPTHIPDVGDFVWVDLHPEQALVLTMRRVDEWWDHPDYPMSARWSTKSEAAAALLADFDEHAPDLVRVTEALREEFVQRLTHQQPVALWDAS